MHDKCGGQYGRIEFYSRPCSDMDTYLVKRIEFTADRVLIWTLSEKSLNSYAPAYAEVGIVSAKPLQVLVVC
jgi:hypothetical protein